MEHERMNKLTCLRMLVVKGCIRGYCLEKLRDISNCMKFNNMIRIHNLGFVQRRKAGLLSLSCLKSFGVMRA